jgi:hypothetical protein
MHGEVRPLPSYSASHTGQPQRPGASSPTVRQSFKFRLHTLSRHLIPKHVPDMQIPHRTQTVVMSYVTGVAPTEPLL